MQSKNFVGSLHGMTQLFKCSDSRHGKLVMPELMVFSEKEDANQRSEEKVRNEIHESSVDAHIHAHKLDHTEVQIGNVEKMIQQVSEQSEDEYLKDALKTARIDRQEQARILSEIEREKKQNRSRPSGGPRYHEAIPDPVIPATRPMHQSPPTSGQHIPISSLLRGHQYSHELPDQDQPKLQLHDQHSVQDELLLGHLGEGRGGGVPLRSQRSMPMPGAANQHQGLVQPPDSVKQPYQELEPATYHNIPEYQSWQPSAGDSQTYQNLPPGGQIQHGGGAGAGVQPGIVPSHVHREQMAQQQQYQQYDQQWYEQQQQRYYEQQLYEQQQRQQHYGLPPTQPPYDSNQHPVPNSQKLAPSNVQPGMTAKVVAPQETVLHSFSMGSNVQFSDPPRYGVIQWIGTLPDIEGCIAGVELVSRSCWGAGVCWK